MRKNSWLRPTVCQRVTTSEFVCKLSNIDGAKQQTFQGFNTITLTYNLFIFTTLSTYTTIGKWEYTPGILEMTAIYQLYTRKRWIYDENLVYDWYTLHIHQVHTRLAFLYVSKMEMWHLNKESLTLTLQKIYYLLLNWHWLI